METSKDIKPIFEMLNSQPGFLPESFFFNEGWMTRLLLFNLKKAFDVCPEKYPFLKPLVQDNCQMFSEAQLDTPFCKTRSGVDAKGLHESNSRADAVIGQFKPLSPQESLNGEQNVYEVTDGCRVVPERNCECLTVFEAKMNSAPANNVTNAEKYNQVSRLAACMLHTCFYHRENAKDKYESVVPSNIDLHLSLIYPGPERTGKTISTKTWLENFAKTNAAETDGSLLAKTACTQITERIKQYTEADKESCPLPDVVQEKNVLYLGKDQDVKQSLQIHTVTYDDLISLLADDSLVDFYDKCLTVGRLKT